MIFLVIPTFLPDSSLFYATIDSVLSNDNIPIGTGLEQNKLNDVIIKIFKEKFPNPNIVFNRFKETEFYTISVENPADIDLSQLEKNYNIDPVLSLNFNDSDTDEPRSVRINKIFFNLKIKRENYISWSDERLYEEDKEAVMGIIHDDGLNLSGVTLNKVNLNNTNYQGTTFAGSVMNDSSFNDATLIGANFTDAELKNAHFIKADLRFADFSVATITGKALFRGANLKFSELVGANLTGADLSDADLRHAVLSGATLTGCIINENTKFYGAIIDDVISDDIFSGANMMQYEDDIEYEEYKAAQLELEGEYEEGEEIDDSVEDELAEEADQEQAEEKKHKGWTEGQILPPLVIDPKSKTSDRYGNNYTFEDMVTLLTPKINKQIKLSEMEVNKNYAIVSLGNTDPDIWTQVGVEIADTPPAIGTEFKCTAIPIPEEGEATVNEVVNTCMDIHELARKIDIDNLLKTFVNIVGTEVFTREYERATQGLVTENEKLKKFGRMLYNLLLYLLSNHNSDETADSWTHIYDDIEKRKQLVKHAVFNKEEGIMYHPRFEHEYVNSYTDDLLLLIMFIESLPLQLQVTWAQHYIQDFIEGYYNEDMEGYGQLMSTFNPKQHMSSGFIASCMNGNFEKFLLSMSTAITKFYPEGWGIVEETAEEKLQNLKNAVTGSLFEKYFKSVETDPAGPSLEGYKNYIQTSPEFNEKEGLRQKYIELLEEKEIFDKITETINIMSGGKKKKHNTGTRRKTNTRKTNTRKTNTRKTNTRKTNTRKTNTRKTYKKKHKKTLKNSKKKINNSNNHKKTLKKYKKYKKY
jgi:uncharacterized protein YjbI with pentapeptide repeats